MALSQRLDLRQTQSLVMTPQLQQAIKLLQLSNIEVQEFVEGEIDRNPLLERGDPSDDHAGSSGADGSATSASRDGVPEPTPTIDTIRDAAPAPVREQLELGNDSPLDTSFENVFSSSDPVEAGLIEGESPIIYGNGGHASFDEVGDNLEHLCSRAPSLRDHLTNQIGTELRDPADRLIGFALLELLDEAGYMSGSLEPVASQLGCTVGRVEAVLARMQRFDPVGVFATSLAGCLAAQLAERNRLDPAMQALLNNLTLLARRDLPGLIRVCGVDDEDLVEMIAEIRALNPKPALAFERDVAPQVTADILVRPHQTGSWIIELNPETLPRVLINREYYRSLSSRSLDRVDRDYVSEQIQSANWLIKSLHQRATTILKVATSIVRHQDAFFRQGVSFLKPLILREIAEDIGMHESTVSRVTANKYMSTPRGMFELKYFFTTAIASSDGQAAVSAEVVRHRIRSLINAETASTILSDDQLVEALKAEGIDIARRTIAKYREAMKIASSVQRRREKTSRL